MNSKIILVAWRDFKQTVLRKAFLIAVLGIPLLIVVVGAVAAIVMIGHEEPPLVGTVAVVEASGEVADAARIEFDEDALRRERDDLLQQIQSDAADSLRSGALTSPTDLSAIAMRGEIRITIESVTDAETEEIRERIRTGELLAAAIIAPQALALPAGDEEGERRERFRLYVGEDVDADHTGTIERRLGDAMARVRAARAGFEYDQARCSGAGGQKPCAVFSTLATEVNSTRRERPIGAPSSDVAVTAANSAWQSMLNPSRSI